MRFGISCIISSLRCVMIILVPMKSLFTKYLHGCHVVTFLFNLALCSSRFWTYAVRVTLLNIINSFSLCLLRHSADPPHDIRTNREGIASPSCYNSQKMFSSSRFIWMGDTSQNVTGSRKWVKTRLIKRCNEYRFFYSIIQKTRALPFFIRVLQTVAFGNWSVSFAAVFRDVTQRSPVAWHPERRLRRRLETGTLQFK